MMRLIAVLIFVMAVLLLLSLSLGAQEIPITDLFAGLVGRGDEINQIIIWQIRLPRSLLAILVGAGLGASGAALQGLLRNPLADPAVVGISSMASLFAAFVIYTGLVSVLPWMLFAGAMLGAGLAALFLLLLAFARASATGLILGGVAMSAMATSATALLMNLSPNPWALSEIAYWLMGSVADRSLFDVMLAAPLILFGVLLLSRAGSGLDLLSLGEDTAASAGRSVSSTGKWVVIGSMLCVGVGVASAGAVGFVGLAAPHLVRPFVKFLPSRTLLPSALVGGILLLFADMVSRALSGPGTPLYLGVVTALLGAPLFLFLVWKTQKEQI